ncbi:MAG: hypothetical protein FRX49_10309 [Trebouxia sp. A1-2]|nr:MAG: hypothetical protein FRX49_10309 [Trebouxia sp. A1-2]
MAGRLKQATTDDSKVSDRADKERHMLAQADNLCLSSMGHLQRAGSQQLAPSSSKSPVCGEAAGWRLEQLSWESAQSRPFNTAVALAFKGNCEGALLVILLLGPGLVMAITFARGLAWLLMRGACQLDLVPFRPVCAASCLAQVHLGCVPKGTVKPGAAAHLDHAPRLLSRRLLHSAPPPSQAVHHLLLLWIGRDYGWAVIWSAQQHLVDMLVQAEEPAVCANWGLVEPALRAAQASVTVSAPGKDAADGGLPDRGSDGLEKLPERSFMLLDGRFLLDLKRVERFLPLKGHILSSPAATRGSMEDKLGVCKEGDAFGPCLTALHCKTSQMAHIAVP